MQNIQLFRFSVILLPYKVLRDLTEKKDLNIDYTIYQCNCFATVESNVLLSHTQYEGSTLYMLISCTPDKDICNFTLGKKSYLTHAILPRLSHEGYIYIHWLYWNSRTWSSSYVIVMLR